jgi:4-amino-4-deoxy-L-arabinose transferase-like glycosyltransferase
VASSAAGGSFVRPHHFFIFLAFITLYRVLSLLQPHLVLFYDEAQYYHWALNPDWGYYSKPPMVAWFIWLCTQLFGQGAFAIKLASPLLYAGSALWLYSIGKQLFDEKTAVAAAWIFATSTLVGYNSLFITTDAPLIFFWVATLWAFLQALHNKHYWLLVGLFCGLGMLSKYTMAALPGSLFLYLLCDSAQRYRLMQPGPWLAAVLAGIIFSSNLVWNWQNGFVAFRHTSEISGVGGGIFPLHLLEFLAAQFVVFGPVWMYMLVRKSLGSAGQLFRGTQALLHFVTYPLLAVICLQALLSHAYINWAGPAYVGGSLLLAHWLVGHKKLLVYGGLLNLVVLSVFYHWPLLADAASVQRSKSNDPWFRVLGYDQVGYQLSQSLQQDQQLLLLSPSRKLLAAVGYYAAPGEMRVSSWQPNADYVADYYDQMFNLRQYQGQPQQAFLLLTQQPADDAMLASFAQARLQQQLSVPVYHNLNRDIWVYYVQGFQGYPHQLGGQAAD